MDGRMVSNLKHCMINSYFPRKKAVLSCCLFLMQGIKPRVLHTVRTFNEMSGKNLRRFYHVKQQEGEIVLTFVRKPLRKDVRITLCRSSPDTCSCLEVLLLNSCGMYLTDTL